MSLALPRPHPGVIAGGKRRPSLDLNFLAGFDSRINFSRASAGWDFDASGNLVQFATDVPRVGPNGLLVEEQRTNNIRNPRCEGAVAGTPGTMPTNWAVNLAPGISYAVVGTGTESGIPYVDIAFNGTSTGSGNGVNFGADTLLASAVAAQAWTHSAYWRVVAGAFPAFLQCATFFSGTGGLSASVAPPTTAPLASQRPQATITTPTGTTQIGANTFATVAIGTAVNVTLRIGAPQLELGDFATSPILPPIGSQAASTRAADAASIPVGSWFNPAAGALAIEFAAPNNGATWQCLARLGDGTNNNRVELIVSNTGIMQSYLTSGGVSKQLNFGAVSTSATHKVASAWNASLLSGSFDGGSVASTSVSSLPSGISGMSLGAEGSGAPLDGYLRRIRYWPRALSNAELQAITT